MKASLGLMLNASKSGRSLVSGGIRVRRVYREVASGKGKPNLQTRPKLIHALIQSKTSKCPILVASQDRLFRNELNALKVMAKFNIISARDGRERRQCLNPGAAKRAEFEGEEISRRTKEALKAACARGKKLGNPGGGVPEVQRKGADANREAAKFRREEFARLFARVWSAGSNVEAIANRLNEIGHVTARGGPGRPPTSIARWVSAGSRSRRGLGAGGRSKRLTMTPPRRVARPTSECLPKTSGARGRLAARH